MRAHPRSASAMEHIHRYTARRHWRQEQEVNVVAGGAAPNPRNIDPAQFSRDVVVIEPLLLFAHSAPCPAFYPSPAPPRRAVE